jgi:hypothetical protein
MPLHVRVLTAFRPPNSSNRAVSLALLSVLGCDCFRTKTSKLCVTSNVCLLLSTSTPLPSLLLLLLLLLLPLLLVMLMRTAAALAVPAPARQRLVYRRRGPPQTPRTYLRGTYIM